MEEDSASCLAVNGWTQAATVHFAAAPTTDGPAGEPERRDFTPADLTI